MGSERVARIAAILDGHRQDDETGDCRCGFKRTGILDPDTWRWHVAELIVAEPSEASVVWMHPLAPGGAPHDRDDRCEREGCYAVAVVDVTPPP